MAINSEVWASSTKKIFTGVLIGLGCAILSCVLNFVLGTSVVGKVLSLLCVAGGLYAIYMQLQGAGEMKTAVEDADMPSVGKIEQAFKLMLVASVVSFLSSLLILVIPVEVLASVWILSILITVVLLIALGIIGLLGAIKGMQAFKALKDSQTFPSKDAASKLYIAYLLYVIYYGCCISVILSGVGALCAIVAYVFAFIGWKTLSETKA